MAKGYKVVQVILDGLWSFSVREDDLGFTEYQEGGWTEPNDDCGPLGVFESIRHARIFRNCMKRVTCPPITTRIYECEYTPANGCGMWQARRSTYTETLPLSLCPTGTLLADKIKLGKCVEEER